VERDRQPDLREVFPYLLLVKHLDVEEAPAGAQHSVHLIEPSEEFRDTAEMMQHQVRDDEVERLVRILEPGGIAPFEPYGGRDGTILPRERRLGDRELVPVVVGKVNPGGVIPLVHQQREFPIAAPELKDARR